MDQLPDILSKRVPVFIIGILVLVTLVAYPRVRRYHALRNIPLVGAEYGRYGKRERAFLANAKAFYEEGHRRFRDAVYRLTTVDGERVVLPPKHLEELRRLSDDQVSHLRFLELALESQYTGVEVDDPFVSHMVRADLTRNLTRINPRLFEETECSVHSELPDHGEWTEVVIYKPLTRIVAKVSGNIFLGPALCHREEYLHASIDCAVTVFRAATKLKKIPLLLRRPFGRFFVPELQAIKDHRARAKSFLVPIVKERKELLKAGKEVSDDMLQWMINKNVAGDDEKMALTQLLLSMAAIHTTTTMITQVIFELMMRPKVVEDVRAEVIEALEKHEGIMTTQALFDMKLLDSVMRETQRVNSANMARFQRQVLKPITLSDGTYLSPGTMIEVPFINIIHDAQIYPNPENFDAYRFYNIRTSNTRDPMEYRNKEQYQFVSVTPENMGFGFGRHACPGRFFAANEIKIILARIILDFEVKPPESIKERYPNVIVGSLSTVDQKGKVMFRRRDVR